MVVDAEDELFVLGADTPVLGRLLAAGKHGQEVVPTLDRRAFGGVGARRSWNRALAELPPTSIRKSWAKVPMATAHRDTKVTKVMGTGAKTCGLGRLLRFRAATGAR